MNYPAIPTLYNGTQYRSRLEARWAAFFDLVGWRHGYEPLDLQGYIPDYLLGESPNQLLAECRPNVDEGWYIDPATTIQRTWAGRAIILASSFEYVLANTQDEMEAYQALCPGVDACGNPLWFVHCIQCQGLSITSSGGLCLRCGNSDCLADLVERAPGVELLWKEAGNKVQWRSAGLTQTLIRRTKGAVAHSLGLDDDDENNGCK